MDIVKAALESSGVEYELIHHEQHLCSAAAGAAFFGIDPGQTAPTLIAETDHAMFPSSFPAAEAIWILNRPQPASVPQNFSWPSGINYGK